ncbi:MAG: hypothetical protein HY821_09990 [Acidobacteria bacterium]|nr:hypothetical protein [Acidobacteriota bacterium]
MRRKRNFMAQPEESIPGWSHTREAPCGTGGFLSGLDWNDQTFDEAGGGGGDGEEVGVVDGVFVAVEVGLEAVFLADGGVEVVVHAFFGAEARGVGGFGVQLHVRGVNGVEDGNAFVAGEGGTDNAGVLVAGGVGVADGGFDGFKRLADFEGEIDDGARSGSEGQSGTVRLLEVVGLHGDCVGTRAEKRHFLETGSRIQYSEPTRCERGTQAGVIQEAWPYSGVLSHDFPPRGIPGSLG